jgi:hypothetical protein
MCNSDTVRHLENVIQAQADEIEHLRSKGIFGFFQRRRLRKGTEAGRIVHRLKEDELRQQNFRLKERVRELENEVPT